MGQELSLGYWDRAFIKALSFGCCVGLYRLLTPSASLRSAPPPQGGRSKSAPFTGEPSIFQKPDRSSLKISAVLALAVFLFLTVGYMLLSPWLDLSAIPEQLRYNDITAATFPVVALYITLVNSLLEEVFFRGFAFLTLRFHPVWFGVFIAGLAVAGMLFDWLDRRGSIWNGWLVHGAANLAINLIGMRTFGIL